MLGAIQTVDDQVYTISDSKYWKIGAISPQAASIWRVGKVTTRKVHARTKWTHPELKENLELFSQLSPLYTPTSSDPYAGQVPVINGVIESYKEIGNLGWLSNVMMKAEGYELRSSKKGRKMGSYGRRGLYKILKDFNLESQKWRFALSKGNGCIQEDVSLSSSTLLEDVANHERDMYFKLRNNELLRKYNSNKEFDLPILIVEPYDFKNHVFFIRASNSLLRIGASNSRVLTQVSDYVKYPRVYAKGETVGNTFSLFARNGAYVRIMHDSGIKWGIGADVFNMKFPSGAPTDFESCYHLSSFEDRINENIRILDSITTKIPNECFKTFDALSGWLFGYTHPTILGDQVNKTEKKDIEIIRKSASEIISLRLDPNENLDLWLSKVHPLSFSCFVFDEERAKEVVKEYLNEYNVA